MIVPTYPGLHAQSSTDVARGPGSEFVGHWIAPPQSPRQISPTSHGSHGPPAGPLNPALQQQSVTAPRPVGADMLGGHA